MVKRLPQTISPVTFDARGGVNTRSWRSWGWLLAALLLLTLQLLSGTGPVYALLVFVFAVLTYQAIKAAGGLSTLVGLCIAAMAAQNVLISQVAKIAFWEPADAPLVRPLETMGLYDLAMAAIWLAAGISTRWAARRKPLFQPEMDMTRLMWLAIISSALACLQLFLVHGHNADAGGAGSASSVLNQVTFLMPLAIASGTAYVIRISNGRRSVGPLNVLLMLLALAVGILGGSREPMILAGLMYVITCIAFKFRFRPVHYIAITGVVCLMQFILFPFALYARSFVRTPRLDENIRRATSILMDVISDPGKYQQLSDPTKRGGVNFYYYGTSKATLDRLSLLIIADRVINTTIQQDSYTGMATITPGFVLSIPRMFNPDKSPSSNISNQIGHRVPGMMGKKDRITGIALGFICDSFVSYGWLGVFVITFLISLAFFAAYRFVINDRIWFNVFALSLAFYLPFLYPGWLTSSMIIVVLQGVPVYVLIMSSIMVMINLATRTERRIRWTRQKARQEAEFARSRAGISRRDPTPS